ncbi:hypothetical protein KIT05_12 [Vibrio phage KIT05]|nr:hypothetical protein KIT05_12 [Vibrio phage KIT05]
MATENGFFTNQTQFQNDPNVSQRDNLKGFYGTAVRPAYVEDLVAKAEEAAAKSYEYSQNSKQYRDEAEVIRDETQAINDQTDQVYSDTVQVYNDTVGVYNDTVVQANNAAQSATDAAQHEAGAANSAVIAAGFAADAEAAFDNFNDLYLGAKPVDPTTDNDGNPLQVGATYWNSTTHDLRFWSGATWDVPEQTAIQAANTAVSASDNAQVSATNAATSETNAAQSAANALSSENAASTSASNAATSETNAATSANNAATSESNAATSASNASTSEANAAQSAADAQQSADDAANTLSELEWKQFVRNEATLNQMREQNKSVRAASGFDHYGVHNDNNTNIFNINEGMYAYIAEPSVLHLGRDTTGTKMGTSLTDYPVTCIAGIVSELLGTNQGAVNTPSSVQIKFPEAPDGTVTYNSATGEVIQHADAATAFALADTSDDIEVVINRVDMFGAEFFLEEVSQANPFVYPKGMIQSQATSMNGITTTTSNRPVTYYAVYDGDTGSQGRGVDFWAATDEQKKALVSDETNNIFMLDDGRLVQWRMRQRTIAGAGNGDWDRDGQSINPVFKSRYGLTAGRGGSVPQGYNDTIPVYGTAYWTPPNGTTNWNVDNTNNGVYQASGGYGGAPFGGMFGLCFFHVWGVVPRLNQGAYHPSFNPLGASLFEGLNTNGSYWYEGNAPEVSNSLDCFTKTSVYTGDGLPNSGSIGGVSGREDGKFYDAIYASGQGGVIDYRLPSWDMSSKEEASKVFQKVVNGSYRGEEELIRTRVFGGVTPSDKATFSGYAQVRFPAGTVAVDFPLFQTATGVRVGGHFVDASGNIFVISGISANSGGYDTVYFDTASGIHSDNINITGACYVVPIEELASSVSGEFTMVDVIGNPAEILATPALANGWLGGWIPVIPDDVNQQYPLTRKDISGNPEGQKTTNNGTSWGTDGLSGFNSTTNSNPAYYFSSTVVVVNYTAFAKQTKSSVKKKVLNAYEGIGNVWATSGYGRDKDWGVLLQESLTGKVGVSDKTDDLAYQFTLSRVSIHSALHIVDDSVGRKPAHSPLTITPPSNNSNGVKSLWYQTANNQQASLNFAWNELVWFSSTTTSRTGTSSEPYTQGTIYYITGGNHAGKILKCVADVTLTLDSYYTGSDGTLWQLNGNPVSQLITYNGAQDGWGDDSTIRITNDTSTYTNLNGDTCLYGTAELAVPYGYTKNQARAGEQTEGVDL